MKFIFPKNYKYKEKIFGFIDYVTAIVDLIIGVLLFLILKSLISNIETLIYFFIIIFLPILLLSIFLPKGENIITYIIQVIKFFKRSGIYLYKK